MMTPAVRNADDIKIKKSYEKMEVKIYGSF